MSGQRVIRYALFGVVILSVLLPAAAYVGVFGALMLFVYNRKSKQMIRMITMNKPMILLLCGILISTLFSKAKLLSLASDIVLFVQLAFYAMLMSESEAQGEDAYFKLLAYLNVMVCLYGIYQLFTGDLSVSRSWVDQKSYGVLVRIYSTFGNPNLLAGYLVMHLSFAVAKIKERRPDLLAAVSIILSSGCLLLTYSRGAFAGFCASMLILFIIKRKKRVLLYLAVMLAAFITFNHTGANMSRADVTALGMDSSSLYRLEIWRSAAALFMAHPLFGNGYGTAWYFLANGSDKLFRYVQHAHNIFLHIAAEMGVVGIISAALFILHDLMKSVKLLKSGVKLKDAYWIEGFIAMAAAAAVHGLVDAVIILPAFGMTCVTYFALYRRVMYKYRAIYQRVEAMKAQPYAQDEMVI